LKLVILLSCLVITSSFGAISKKVNLYSIPKKDIDVNVAKKWFDHYYSAGQDRFREAFKKGGLYKDSIELVLNRYNIPLDFYYLAMTESYFNNFAMSPKKAAGIWQFIPSTAKAYGLVVNDQIDERLHPIKSTIAAAKYIKDLYNIFQDWTLAAAAYNCGEYRVLRAIKKAESRSFAVLAKKKLLPNETINYISKIWVTREIDLKIRQAESPKERDKYLSLSPITIKKHGLSLDTFSLITEISVDEILTFNPDLIKAKGILPSDISIYLPTTKAMNYTNFIRFNGVISNLRYPGSLKKYGFDRSREGDKIKVTFVSKKKINVKNIRTKEQVTLDKLNLPSI